MSTEYVKLHAETHVTINRSTPTTDYLGATAISAEKVELQAEMKGE